MKLVDQHTQIRKDRGTIQPTNVGYLLEKRVTWDMENGEFYTSTAQFFGEAYGVNEDGTSTRLDRDMLTHVIRSKNSSSIYYRPVVHVIHTFHTAVDQPFSTALSVSSENMELGEEKYPTLYQAEEACAQYVDALQYPTDEEDIPVRV